KGSNMPAPLPTTLTDSRVRRGDIVLDRVEALILAHNSAINEYAALIQACDLFFTLDYWLKWYKINGSYEVNQAPTVTTLYGMVVERLMAGFQCTVNVLPRELELMFGRELTTDGYDTDYTQGLAKFAEKPDVNKYRLWFKGGKIYQYPWWKPNWADGALVPAES